jgi:hypothetical protein
VSEDVILALDALTSAAETEASAMLRLVPTFPEGRYGDHIEGAIRQPDGSYQGDYQSN